MVYSKPIGLVSLFLVIASWVVIFTKELNLGIDFAGGTVIQAQYFEKAPVEKIREALDTKEAYRGANVTHFGSEEEVVIRIKSSSGNLSVDIGDEMRMLLQNTDGFKEIRRVDMVGAKVGSELREKGMTALALAIIGILIYVAFRFEWRFAVASVLALVHDISIAMGAVVLVGIEVNLDTLAAMLTILGYSLNDTIIVFDRIREELLEGKEINMGELIDESVTRTLSRTTLTSWTVFIVVFMLFMFGGEIMQAFSFPLLVGVVVGTYSSIFVASPILMWLGFSVRGFREKESDKLKREKEKEKMRAMYESGTL